MTEKASRIENRDQIDPKVFGEKLRNLRRGKGFKNTQEYSKGIFLRTGVTISDRTLKRIEAGRTLVSIQTLVTISLTLFNDPLSVEIIEAVRSSLAFEPQVLLNQREAAKAFGIDEDWIDNLVEERLKLIQSGNIPDF